MWHNHNAQLANFDLASLVLSGFVDLAFNDIPRIPLFQPYSNVAMQKNVTGYQYWFHRRLDYRAFSKG